MIDPNKPLFTIESVLIASLENGLDPHTHVASFMLNKPVDQINYLDRNKAKCATFHLTYNPDFMSKINWPK